MIASLPNELFDGSIALEEGQEWNAEILSALGTCKGLLLFADADFKPVQLLQSANLRRTAQARLLMEEDAGPTRKTDLSRCVKHIFYVCCCNDFQTAVQLSKTAHAIGGGIFQDRIKWPKTAFAVLESAAPLPYFHVSFNPEYSETRKAWGLFPSSKTAHEFCRILNIAFNLCRNPSLLQTGNEASCPYLQMHQCPGPCLNTASQQAYWDQVRLAITAADGQIDDAIVRLTAEMKQAALNKRFEQAQLRKDKINLLRQRQAAAYDWTDNLERFSLLHIDRGHKIQEDNQKRKQQQFTAWKITARQIWEIGRFTLNEPDRWKQTFLTQWDNPVTEGCQLSRQDHFGLLSLLLYRSSPQGIWINAARHVPTAEEVFEKTAAWRFKNKEDADLKPTSSLPDVAPRGFEPLSPG